METFVAVSFWFLVLAVTLRALFISNAKYPRITQWTVGMDMIWLATRAGFAIWAAYLIWGAQ